MACGEGVWRDLGNSFCDKKEAPDVSDASEVDNNLPWFDANLVLEPFQSLFKFRVKSVDVNVPLLTDIEAYFCCQFGHLAVHWQGRRSRRGLALAGYARMAASRTSILSSRHRLAHKKLVVEKNALSAVELPKR